MKKIRTFLLAFAMLIVLTGCGSDTDSAAGGDSAGGQGTVNEGGAVDNTTDKEDASDSDKEETEGGESASINDTAVENLKGGTLDYYWNIDTQDFDKSKFDGKISFYGSIIEGKLTTEKLQEAGIEVSLLGVDTTLKTNSERDYWYYETPRLLRDGEKLPMSTNESIYSPIIINFVNDELYSEHSNVVEGYAYDEFHWGLLEYNIYPTVLGVESPHDITIDLVLEKLGAPTYVVDRTDKTMSEKDLYAYTVYLYVYDDVAFLFAFYNNRDLKLAADFYYPIEIMNKEDDNGRSALERLEDQYQTYLSSK